MAAAPNSPRSLVARSCWRRVNTRSSRWRSVRLTEVGKPQGRSVQSTRSRRCPWARWTQRCTVASATPKRSATWRMEAPCRTAWTIARRRWVAAVFCSWQTPQEQVSSHAKPVELTSECLRGGDLRVLALTLLKGQWRRGGAHGRRLGGSALEGRGPWHEGAGIHGSFSAAADPGACGADGSGAVNKAVNTAAGHAPREPRRSVAVSIAGTTASVQVPGAGLKTHI